MALKCLFLFLEFLEKEQCRLGPMASSKPWGVLFVGMNKSPHVVFEIASMALTLRAWLTTANHEAIKY